MRYRVAIAAALIFALIGPGVALAAPTNDNFSAAQLIPSSGGSLTGASNVGATAESGEPAHAGSTATHSVWYVWTPSAAGNVDVNTCTTSFDTVVAVYTGTAVNALTSVISNDDGSCMSVGGSSTGFFAVQGGTTYHIAVDGKGGATGTFDLNVIYNPASGGDVGCPDCDEGGTTGIDTKITGLVVNSAKRKATVSFKAVLLRGTAITFECKLDRKAYAPCTSPKTYKKLKVGKHKISVRAVQGSQQDPTPAVRKFKIKP